MLKQLVKESLSLLDMVSWLLVLLFFCGSAWLNGGNLQESAIGALAVVIEMLLITLAIEIIIECLQETKGIGTITGFITNGPEAVVLLVGLLGGNIVFAASTPLGSNFMNPLLLFLAALLSRKTLEVVTTRSSYTVTTCFFTAFLAGSFFMLGTTQHYIFWLFTALSITVPLFFIRPKEEEKTTTRTTTAGTSPSVSWRRLIAAIILLICAGYWLDPVVTSVAKASKAPKGVIGFLVLSTLTSWPEFKSCIALLRRGSPLAAILNITISNITNIWLAAAGLGVYLVVE